MSPSCWRNRRRIDAAFVGTLDEEGLAKLRAHTEGCAECRARYDRLGRVDRALHSEGMTRAIQPAGGRDLRRRRWVIFIAADALAVAVALFFFLRPRPKDEFRARGGKGQRLPGVSLFCLDNGQVTGRVSAAAAPLPPPALTCKLSDELQIAYTAPAALTDSGIAMIVWADDEQGQRFWYVPRRADGDALAVERDATDRLIPWATRLEVKHHPGRFTVHVRLLRGQGGTADELVSAPALGELTAILEIAP